MARTSLDGPSQARPASRDKGPAGDPASAKKAVLAIAAIVIAGGLIAWSMGYFSGTPTFKGKPVPASGDVLTPAAQKQMDGRKRLEALPDGNPKKPKTVGG